MSAPAEKLVVSKEDEEYLARNPLGPILKTFRESFEAHDEGIFVEFSKNKNNLSVNRIAIAGLIKNLTDYAIDKDLGSGTDQLLDVQLISTYKFLRSSSDDLSIFDQLTTTIVNNASDHEVWKAILRLAHDYEQMPIQLVSEFPRKEGEDWWDFVAPLRRQFRESTFKNVGGFWEKYFEGHKWVEQCSYIFQSLNKTHNENALKAFTDTTSEESIWHWLHSFQSQYLSQTLDPFVSPSGDPSQIQQIDAHPPLGKYFRMKRANNNPSGQNSWQFDVFVSSRDVPVSHLNRWRNVLVVGGMSNSVMDDCWHEKFLELSVYMREIFWAQPLRLFVHGFHLFGTQLLLWVFDRAGAFSSDTIEILHEPERFIRVITAYTLMDDDQLGLATFLKVDGRHSIITMKNVTDGKNQDFALELGHFLNRELIVSRGTTCYRTMDGENLVKFSWRDPENKSEAELLLAAQNVNGVLNLLGSRDITSIGKLRNGLVFPRKMANMMIEDFGPYACSGDSLYVRDASQEKQLLKKDGVSRDITGIHECKDESKLLPKKCNPSTCLESKSQCEVKGLPAIESIYEPPFTDRVFSCFSASPFGRPISAHSSVQEFLTCMRDAIKAHKDLFEEAKILHCDISEKNILLVDPKKQNGLTGMLIDLDNAIWMGVENDKFQAQARIMRGTPTFIAIEKLCDFSDQKSSSVEHTYRHDLESFFYVFLVVCIEYGWDDQQRPKESPLQEWYVSKLKILKEVKQRQMKESGFELFILEKFSPKFGCVKDLARQLRNILFSKGKLSTGTPDNPEEMYGLVLEAFESALEIC
ncbi:serine/threonine-protein kinase Sgk2 [Blumeria hordei DH14]|uniref:Serine/threonine-protein kinase Sgk2 n=1 Tax=Blumeria graminis f. sp. hordei (strain DH14) TaxID=546991 RepID=N1J5P5_BLUG1|nr:serine/threonine-protein kinase Sgk2 [Blumeria hordei DH14]